MIKFGQKMFIFFFFIIFWIYKFRVLFWTTEIFLSVTSSGMDKSSMIIFVCSSLRFIVKVSWRKRSDWHKNKPLLQLYKICKNTEKINFMMSNFEVYGINGSNENYQYVKTLHVHMYMQRKHEYNKIWCSI